MHVIGSLILQEVFRYRSVCILSFLLLYLFFPLYTLQGYLLVLLMC